jgi:hypothetical protein
MVCECSHGVRWYERKVEGGCELFKEVELIRRSNHNPPQSAGQGYDIVRFSGGGLSVDSRPRATEAVSQHSIARRSTLNR